MPWQSDAGSESIGVSISEHGGDEGDEQLASLASLTLRLHRFAHGLQARSANCFLAELAPAHLPGPMSCVMIEAVKAVKGMPRYAKCLHGPKSACNAPIVGRVSLVACSLFTILAACVWPSWVLLSGPNLHNFIISPPKHSQISWSHHAFLLLTE